MNIYDVYFVDFKFKFILKNIKGKEFIGKDKDREDDVENFDLMVFCFVVKYYIFKIFILEWKVKLFFLN